MTQESTARLIEQVSNLSLLEIGRAHQTPWILFPADNLLIASWDISHDGVETLEYGGENQF